MIGVLKASFIVLLGPWNLTLERPLGSVDALTLQEGHHKMVTCFSVYIFWLRPSLRWDWRLSLIIGELWVNPSCLHHSEISLFIDLGL